MLPQKVIIDLEIFFTFFFFLMNECNSIRFVYLSLMNQKGYYYQLLFLLLLTYRGIFHSMYKNCLYAHSLKITQNNERMEIFHIIICDMKM